MIHSHRRAVWGEKVIKMSPDQLRCFMIIKNEATLNRENISLTINYVSIFLKCSFLYRAQGKNLVLWKSMRIILDDVI